jgi:hypothetical protein
MSYLYILFKILFYRKYCRPTISVLGVNLHDAHSSPLVNIPKSLHSGLDGLLVEMVCLFILELLVEFINVVCPSILSTMPHLCEIDISDV